MADRGDTHYHVLNLNRWFAISSLLLLVSIVWMVLDDYYRPWKENQRTFREKELEKTVAELESEEAQEKLAEESRLEEALARAQDQLEAREDELDTLQEELRQLKSDQFIATEEAKKLKQEYAWERFVIEEHRAEHGDPDYGAERLEEYEQAWVDAEGRKEAVDFQVADKEAQLAAIRSHVTEAESAVANATKDIDLLRKKVESIDPSSLTAEVANRIRDFPGLDFIGPNLKVQKVVLDDLTFELNFTRKTRIDMCVTCHLASERKGYEDEENPYKTHPRLDLFLSAKSPHPYKEVGCTICHRGSGEALDFIRADHRPSNEEEEHDWEEEYHWHKQHHWDYPMLSSRYIEASCVQCHKTTMDLIAEDAPRVSEGYELFEESGCYSCHKVEWFPTQRKRGPSLKHIESKASREFVASWIAHPKDFRPTTRMPQFFHLENFAPEMVIAEAEYGTGREIYGQEWNDAAVASITAYLFERSEPFDLEPVPVEGDPERGREVFRLTGCLACHNLEPHPGDEPKTRDPAFEADENNSMGPNLRGVATKISREWLYSWLQQPHAYWPDTRMPDLRLSDQDAADIAAYVIDDPDGHFHDVPDGWEPVAAPYDMEVLAEQARWFFSRLGREEIRRRLAGEVPEHRWDQPEELLVAVGEKFVLNQGCYSCHEIKGLEDTMPIGTELTEWGSKTVDRLDWALVANLLAEEHGWSLDKREHYKQYRENWIELKLDSPRIFDREKVKNPLERLRMPWFDFEEDQIEAIATFVVGLVADEVERAKMEPTYAEQAISDGKRVVRQKNCQSCHVVDPGTVTFRDEADQLVTVDAELMPIGEDIRPPRQTDLAALQESIASYEEYYEEDVEEVGFRLLGPAPGVGLPGRTVFVSPDRITEVTPPEGGGFVNTVTAYYFNGIEMYDPEAESEDDAYWAWNLGEEGEVEDVDGELRAYYEQQYDKIRWTFAPPVLYDEGHKLQPEWFYSFLMDPVPLRKQIRVRMPSFNYHEGEAEAVADYFANKAVEDWHARYAKTLRMALGLELDDGYPLDGLPWPEAGNAATGGTGLSVEEMARRTGLSPESVRQIEAGYEAEIAANFSKLRELAADTGFEMNGPISPEYEWIERSSPSYLAQHGHRIDIGENIAVNAVNCYQCHWHGGEPPEQLSEPLAWAPDLALTEDRLRPEWVEDWLWNPLFLYPGTSMPANFTGNPPQYQETYPDSSNDDQIQAVLDWLFNFSRPAPVAGK